MSSERRFWFSQFSIRHLFLAVSMGALIAFLVTIIPPEPPDESMLATKDREILSQLRVNGLNIAMQHMCGMGDLAGFDIERCKDRKYHITKLYIQHRDPIPFINDISSLPELMELTIGDVYSSNYLTIDDKSKFNTKSVQEVMADGIPAGPNHNKVDRSR